MENVEATTSNHEPGGTAEQTPVISPTREPAVFSPRVADPGCRCGCLAAHASAGAGLSAGARRGSGRDLPLRVRDWSCPAALSHVGRGEEVPDKPSDGRTPKG